ncbi:class I SAM-dependent methyltransferase [Streptomyces lavendulae]|uniref:class I SAM-dependent methyltransferase n=1 Tax=Streptomyces lavendulae TaxID=1914 RepID=UPI0036C591FC
MGTESRTGTGTGTDGEARVDRARGRVFGEVAELYDASRPGYADALVARVLEYAEPGERPALEVGAGTGKATVPFAEAGTTLVCVEPDPRMAEVLRRNTARFPRVRVEAAGFEEWPRDGRRFALLYAATSWHWLDPARRRDLVREALDPGGALALFWNPHGVRDPGLHGALAEVDARPRHHRDAARRPRVLLRAGGGRLGRDAGLARGRVPRRRRVHRPARGPFP